MKDDPRWKFFKCQQCGRCCIEIGLPYDAKSAIPIANFLNISLPELIKRYYGKVVIEGQCWCSQDEKRTPCPTCKPIPKEPTVVSKECMGCVDIEKYSHDEKLCKKYFKATFCYDCNTPMEDLKALEAHKCKPPNNK